MTQHDPGDDIVDLRTVKDEALDIIDRLNNGGLRTTGPVSHGDIVYLRNAYELFEQLNADRWDDPEGDDPILIRDEYMVEYAAELAADVGAISDAADWPLTHIDWETAANDLKVDYWKVMFGGHVYWTRG